MMKILRTFTILNITLALLTSCGKEEVKETKSVLVPVKAGNNWGYIDSTCSFKLEPVYEAAGEFHNNRALVMKGGKASFIDDFGKLVGSFQFLKVTDFSDSLAFVLNNANTIQCVDINAKVKFSLPQIQEAKVFREGLAAVKQNDKYGFIDKAGKIVIPCQFDDVLSFSEGLCAVAFTKQQADSSYSEWFYIDKTGKTTLKGSFEVALNFNKGLAAVKQAGKSYWIDKTGKNSFGKDFEDCQSFAEGFAAFKKDGSWGLINKSGKIILEPSYALIGNFNNSLAMVSLGVNTVGFIDTTGTIKVKPDFQSASYFRNGYAYVCKDNRISLLTKNGQLFCASQFDSAPGFLGSDVGFVDFSLNSSVQVNDSIQTAVMP